MPNTLAQAAILDAALSYASRGFYVFPLNSIKDVNGTAQCTCGRYDCHSIGKHPLHRRWQQEATIDPTRIKQLFTPMGEVMPNIGIATGKMSGITVVDIDIDHGGLEHWNSITEEINVPETYTVKTGSGGFHLYFKYSPLYQTKTNALGEGIDIRNEGGFVVAPPSLHKSGRQYFAQSQSIELAEMPADLVRFSHGMNSTKKVSHSSMTLERAASLLEYVGGVENYSTWFNVGLILARTFDRSDEAFELFKKWSDRGYNKADKGSASRMQKMRSVFYDASTQTASSGESVGAGTLYQYAKEGGFSDIKTANDISRFCYLANENAFLFLPTGEKWIATGVDSSVPAVYENGQYIKASQWLRNNKNACCMTVNGDLPAGFISGYVCKDGLISPLPGACIVNMFNPVGNIAPFPDNVLQPVKLDFAPKKNEHDRSEALQNHAMQLQGDRSEALQNHATQLQNDRSEALQNHATQLQNDRSEAGTVVGGKIIYDAPAWMAEGF